MSDMDEPRDGTYRSLETACEAFIATLPPSRTLADNVKRDALRARRSTMTSTNASRLPRVAGTGSRKKKSTFAAP
jgi:hypothetical protein